MIFEFILELAAHPARTQSETGMHIAIIAGIQHKHSVPIAPTGPGDYGTETTFQRLFTVTPRSKMEIT